MMLFALLKALLKPLQIGDKLSPNGEEIILFPVILVTTIRKVFIMSNKFSVAAKKATTLSPIMEGKERLTVDDVISLYPDYITIDGFDIITSGAESYPVLTFAEDSSKFVFGGAIMNNICHDWAGLCDGDIEEASKQLGLAGGVKIKFEKTRTKAGNNLTKPIIID